MANRQYTVASTAQLVGVPTAEERYFEGIKAMDHANREKSQIKRRTEVQKGGRLAPSPLRTDSTEEEASPGTEVFTHSRHASWSSSSPTTAIPEWLPKVLPQKETLLLQPVAYIPPAEKIEPGSLKSTSSNDSQTTLKGHESQASPHDSHQNTTSKSKDLECDPDASTHIRSPSNESTLSRRRGRRSDGSDIYFTPTDYTKSRIFLSSPQTSPTLPGGDTNEGEDGAATPRPSAASRRPSSEIFVRGHRFGTPSRITRKQKLKITPEQLDQLVTALVNTRMIQQDVRKHWWDVDDIPDDETMSSFSAVSIPTLTSASTLYSQPGSSFYSHPNDNFVNSRPSSKDKKENSPKPKQPATPTDAPFGGIALTDPKIHGSPIRFISQDYRIGGNVLSVGSCSFVQVPYGVDVECTLRVEPRSHYNTTCRVMFQCVNQVVERKAGKRIHLLIADEDVTELLTKTALAELSAFTNTDPSLIDVVASPTAPSPFQSPDIDWIAVADELQTASETTALIESTVTHLTSLSKETCQPQITTLLSTLESIKDQHTDFLILRPTAFRPNGVPQSMRLPWVSQRLYHDWYETETSIGHSDAAKAFQEQIVAAVAKKAVDGGKFSTEVRWEEERLVVLCVPLSEGVMRGRGDVWACFVRGTF